MLLVGVALNSAIGFTGDGGAVLKERGKSIGGNSKGRVEEGEKREGLQVGRA